jgi:UDP-3-O-acyl-N-acetylglucosamine deacetylase
MMRKMGLFAHLTPAQMLVIGPDGPVENAYRFSDEPARHKVLDMLGDLALAGAGRPIHGRVTAWRSGHALNHAMARRLAELQ